MASKLPNGDLGGNGRNGDAPSCAGNGGHRDGPASDGVAAEPIAVVGFALQFPQGATSPEAFWQMLSEGRNAATEFPRDRLNIDAFYHPDASRHNTV